MDDHDILDDQQRYKEEWYEVANLTGTQFKLPNLAGNLFRWWLLGDSLSASAHKKASSVALGDSPVVKKENDSPGEEDSIKDDEMSTDDKNEVVMKTETTDDLVGKGREGVKDNASPNKVGARSPKKEVEDDGFFPASKRPKTEMY